MTDTINAPAVHAAAPRHRTATGLSNTKLAMWVYLGSDCLLFGTPDLHLPAAPPPQRQRPAARTTCSTSRSRR